jgi:hypothetical protein
MKGEHVMNAPQVRCVECYLEQHIATLNPRSCATVTGLMALLHGITLQPSALKRWALSMHTCSQLVQDVADI